MLLRPITILAFLILTVASASLAQDKVTPAQPAGGIHRLQIRFYTIPFTHEQRQRLNHRELEFIFIVHENGSATLQKVNGISDTDILDSLYSVTFPEKAFHPQTVNGTAEESLYIVSLQFPTFGASPELPGYYHYKEPMINDFDYLELSSKVDMLIGGVGNAYAGNSSRHLRPGGGMKVDLIFANRKGNGGGLVMSFYSNTLKKAYPISTIRPQNRVQSVLLIGGAYRFTLREDDSRRDLSLQLELNYAMQNLVTRDSPNDDYYVQVQGISPALVAHYALPIGRDRLSNYYGRPAIVRNKLNFHGALRPVFMDRTSASGLMIEAGIAYRLQFIFVREFKLRADFFN